MAQHHEHTKPTTDSIARGHETTDADAQSIAISGIALSVGLMLVAIMFSWMMYVVFKSHSSSPGSPSRTFVTMDSTALPPLPRLQADPALLLSPFVKNQDSILSSYGWVNKDSGIARIPIDRAMQIVVERGLPVQEK